MRKVGDEVYHYPLDNLSAELYALQTCETDDAANYARFTAAELSATNLTYKSALHVGCPTKVFVADKKN